MGRFVALRFFLNCTLDQCHRDALGRALGDHEPFRRLTLRHGLGDGEVEGRGDAPGIKPLAAASSSLRWACSC